MKDRTLGVAVLVAFILLTAWAINNSHEQIRERADTCSRAIDANDCPRAIGACQPTVAQAVCARQIPCQGTLREGR